MEEEEPKYGYVGAEDDNRFYFSNTHNLRWDAPMMNHMLNPERYEQLKAKIAEVCPEIELRYSFKLTTHELNSALCDRRLDHAPITIAHVLRTLGDRYLIAADGQFAQEHCYEGCEEPIKYFPFKFDLTTDLDGQSDASGARSIAAPAGASTSGTCAGKAAAGSRASAGSTATGTSRNRLPSSQVLIYLALRI